MLYFDSESNRESSAVVLQTLGDSPLSHGRVQACVCGRQRHQWSQRRLAAAQVTIDTCSDTWTRLIGL